MFICDASPVLCARALDDVRLSKMCLETAQMLSTAAHAGVIPASVDKLYKSSYESHPVVRWVCESSDHAYWTRHLLLDLDLEYLQRGGKRHASCAQILEAVPAPPPTGWGEVGRRWQLPVESEFYNCTSYPSLPVYDAYRVYLVDKWRGDVEKDRCPTWRRRGPPEWLEAYLWREA